MSVTRTRRPASKRSRADSLDVVVLHDDTKMLENREGSEAHVGVWEAILPIEESLKRQGHRMKRVSLGKGIAPFIQTMQKSPPDVVFHLAETAFGDIIGEARMTALLELLNIPHTSAATDAILLCRDKLKTKAFLQERGILTPAHAVSFDGRMPDRLPIPPWISKPTLEDGSIGVTGDAVTSDPLNLRRRIHALHSKMRQPILIESFIDGREFNLGIVGDDALPLAEIDFTKLPKDSPRILAYESKWKYETAYFKCTTTVCPAPIPAGLRDRLIRVGRAALDALNVRGYSRVDFRVDSSQQIYILEVNPNPDLSPIAGMAKMAETAGWGFDGLVNRILAFALRRR